MFSSQPNSIFFVWLNLFRSARGVTRRRSLVEEPVVQQPNGFQQQPIDALQLFTADLQKQLGQKECKKGDFNAVVETKWAELSYDEKRAYYDRATAAASPIEGASAKPKKTTNIPLPALKRFAATIASGLKEKQPHLAELQHVRTVSCFNFLLLHLFDTYYCSEGNWTK